MKPLFYAGQLVIAVDSTGEFDNDTKIDLIEGKSYTIDNPDYKHDDVVNTSVTLIGHEAIYWQKRFIPASFDRQADEEIHEALKGEKIILKYSSSN